MTSSKEIRCCQSELSVDRRTLHGYAIVFDALSDDLGGFRERIHRSAVDASLARRSDVMALTTHNQAMPLGRTQAGTLRLLPDDRGLAVEIDLPNTTYASDLIEQIKRGDVTGMSFGFFDKRSRWSYENGVDVRNIEDFDLLEVSVTSSPAYPDTSVALRQLYQRRGNLAYWRRYLRRIVDGGRWV